MEFDPRAGELLCEPATQNQRMASMEFAWTHISSVLRQEVNEP
jgi:hypothetical protein